MGQALVVGGGGFIGRRVVVALAEAGEEPTAPSRDEFDIAQGAPEALAAKLAGVDVVVNCAGIGRDGRVDNLRAAHVEGPSRLAAACKIAGVRRLVHVSALGAAAGDASRFLASKGEGEAALARHRRTRGLYRAAVAGAGRRRRCRRLLRRARRAANAATAGTGNWRVQPLHVDELAALIAKLALAPQAPASVDAVGPEAMTTDALEAGLREWLGLRTARILPAPRFVLAALAWANEIVEVGPGDRELVAALERGNVGDPTGAAAALGRPPRSLWQSLERAPATIADLWRARLYFVQPLLRLSIALLWIGTALASFGLFPVADSYVILAEVGVRAPFADLALFGGAAVNLALGAMLLVNVRVAAVGVVMLALLIFYSLVGLALPADYWLNPFAPILKNMPIGAALLALIAMEKPRRRRAR